MPYTHFPHFTLINWFVPLDLLWSYESTMIFKDWWRFNYRLFCESCHGKLGLSSFPPIPGLRPCDLVKVGGLYVGTWEIWRLLAAYDVLIFSMLCSLGLLFFKWRKVMPYTHFSQFTWINWYETSYLLWSYESTMIFKAWRQIITVCFVNHVMADWPAVTPLIPGVKPCDLAKACTLGTWGDQC